MSSFIRRAAKKELASLGFLNSYEAKAVGAASPDAPAGAVPDRERAHPSSTQEGSSCP